MYRLLLMASGSGSNAEAIVAHCAARGQVEVVAIVSDRKAAGVHERARRLGIPTVHVGKRRRDAPGGLLEVLRGYRPDLVALAGYLQLVPRDVLDAFPQRVVNIHPALLPKYGGPGMYGRYVHKAVVAAAERQTGITIHLADARYDEGAILFQATVELASGEDASAAAAKVLTLEHRHYPHVLTAYLRKLGPAHR